MDFVNLWLTQSKDVHMLDTIRLTFQNTTPDALKQRNDGELWTLQTLEDGSLQKQYVIQRLNVTDDGKAYNGTFAISYDYRQNFMNVGVSSLPAMLHGTSFAVLTSDDMKRIAPELQARITPYVDIDINNGVFTRLDNSTLFDMNEAPSRYIGLLDELTRNSQHRMKKTYYQGESVQFRNKQRCIGFYDKYAKNRHNAVEMRFLQTHDVDGKQNALRYEIQNKHGKTVRQLFGKDIHLDDLTTDFFIQRLHRQRINMFNKHFQLAAGDIRTKLEDWYKTYTFMQTKYQRFSMDKALWYIALEKDFVSLDMIEKIMLVSGASRQSIHKRMKQLRELVAHDVEKSTLFHELKEKIEDTIAA